MKKGVGLIVFENKKRGWHDKILSAKGPFGGGIKTLIEETIDTLKVTSVKQMDQL